MADIVGTVTAVKVERGPDTNPGFESVILGVTTTTQVVGGTDVLRIADVNASVGAFARDGKTRTVIAVQMWQLAATASTVYGATVSETAANRVDIVPKSVADFSTNATLPATGVLIPYQVVCLCKVS